MEGKVKGERKVIPFFILLGAGKTWIWVLSGGRQGSLPQESVLPQLWGGRRVTDCIGHRAQRGCRRTHTSFIVFPHWGAHTSRKDAGLDVGGEAQEKWRDGEGIPSNEGQRGGERNPPAGQPCQSLTDIYLIQVLARTTLFQTGKEMDSKMYCLESFKTERTRGRERWPPPTKAVPMCIQSQFSNMKLKAIDLDVSASLSPVVELSICKRLRKKALPLRKSPVRAHGEKYAKYRCFCFNRVNLADEGA